MNSEKLAPYGYALAGVLFVPLFAVALVVLGVLLIALGCFLALVLAFCALCSLMAWPAVPFLLFYARHTPEEKPGRVLATMPIPEPSK